MANESEPTNPIKPQLALRVGITGHRHASTIKIKGVKHPRYPQRQKKRVIKQIEDTLIFCRKIVQNIHSDSEFREFYSKSTPRLRFFSALAEGADQEAAESALNLGKNAHGNDETKSSSLSYTLECIFPFPRDKYKEYFSEPEVIQKFDDLLQHENLQSIFALAGPIDELYRPKAYEASGVLMLENIDILIAVWDGWPSSLGGTGDIVEKAQSRNIPIVWIRSNNDKPMSFWCHDYRLAKEGFENIPDNHISNCDNLQSEVRRLIAPPSSQAEKKAHDLLGKFFEDEKPKKPGAKSYKRFRDWVAKKKCPAEPEDDYLGRDDWDRFVELCSDDVGCLKNQTENLLRSRHRIVDKYAVYYANQYRSAYLWMFALAGLAVGIGLLALFNPNLTLKGIWTSIELIILLLIALIFIKSKRNNCHQQFLDFRMIAEHLRHARFLALAGRAGGGWRSAVEASPSERFVEWYVRATLRELFIPSKCVDPDYIQYVKNVMVESELEGPFGQIRYNKQNHLVLKELNEWLHWWSEWLFKATAVACSIYLVSVLPYLLFDVPVYYESFIKTWLKNPLTYLAAVFPAFAATLSGIKYQGDFEAFAERSHSTQKKLEVLQEILNNEKRVLSLNAVSERFKTCADIMAHDVGAWRMIYSFRPLETPG